MSDQYEIEVLLRPAVEVYGAIVCLACALIIWLLPDLLFLPVVVANGSAIVLTLFGLKDLRDATRVWRYRSRMKRTPSFSMAMGRIPKVKGKLYLGRGFRWTQKHSQRLVDTLEPRYSEFMQIPDSQETHPFFRGVVSWIPGLRTLVNADVSFNPFRPPSQTGGNPALHGVGINEVDVFLPEKAREGNTLMFGTTGAGKTRAMEVNIAQDINRPDKPVVIVFDPKGDGELLKRICIEVRRAGREKELQIFHLGYPDHSVRYNGVGNYTRITEIATRIANQLPTEGSSAAFKEFAWRFANLAARVLNELGERPGYKEIRQAVDDIEPLMIRYINQYIELTDSNLLRAKLADLQAADENSAEMPKNFSGRTVKGYRYYKLYEEHSDLFDDPIIGDLAACIKYDKTYYDKLVSSVGPLMEKLTSGLSGKLLSPEYFDTEDPRAILDWRTLIRQRGIAYIGLDALSDATVSSAAGQSMLADLTSFAGEIYKHGAFSGTPDKGVERPPRILMHLDEVNELIADEFIPLVNKCRGAGMIVNAYTQASSDIQVKVGSAAKAEQINANFANLIMMRVRNIETAEILCKQLPEVSIDQVMAVTGATDSDYLSESHFTSRNEDRTTTTRSRMLDPSALMQLPNGQAFALMEGGRLYKLRFPLPDADKDDVVLPAEIELMISEMNKQVITNNWAEEVPWWNAVGEAA